MPPSLPLYYRKGGIRGNGSQRLRLFNCLAIFLVTFVLAWILLMTHMPKIQQTNISFDGSYNRFSPRSEDLGTSQDEATSLYFSSPKLGEHVSVSINQINESGNNEQKIQTSSSKDPFEVQLPFEKKRSNVTVAVVTDKPSLETVSETKNKLVSVGKNVTKQESTRLATAEKPSLRAIGPVAVNNKLSSWQALNMTQPKERRDKIKEMIQHAWNGYRNFAFGANELRPISKTGHSAGVFGKTKMGATLIDSLDTLFIAGLMDEFNEAKKWVEEEFHIDEVNTEISVFEFNIRFVGGLLSAYALSKDKIFSDKAQLIADKLLPAFNTPSGIPKSVVNLKNGAAKNWKWAAGGSSILSEIGSFHLEFQYLTKITNNPIYFDKVLKIRSKLREMAKADGLYPNFVNSDTGQFTQRHISLGALGDSFYEYLIKSWVVTSKKDNEGFEMFTNTVKKMEPAMFQKKDNGLLLVTDIKNGRSDGKMQHLTCFSGGMFALAAMNDHNRSLHYQELAEGITAMCHQSYTKSPTRVGPEAFRLDSEGSVISRANEKVYLLRPETVESYFYMWRLTHDQKYREWGWEVVQALESYCRVDNGYCGLKDVTHIPPARDDVQQSFFIAETLKYLYLLFSDDSVISLDNWVFNTEAHPLPVLTDIPTVAVTNSIVATNQTKLV